MNKKAIILLSGGLDSATALYLAKSKGFELYSMAFDYGQQHEKELKCAQNIAKRVGVKEHRVVSLNMNAWGGSALTDNCIEIPDFKGEEQIPVTYVPARNMVFLSIAASYAEVVGAQDIFIGVSEVDYSGYVDCREEFILAMEKAINKGTVCAVEKNKPIRLQAPFLYKTKAEEILIGKGLGVDYSLTWSCYKGDAKACGKCDSCVLRIRAFEKVGLVDPIDYEE